MRRTVALMMVGLALAGGTQAAGMIEMPPHARGCANPYDCLESGFELKAATTLAQAVMQHPNVTDTLYFTKGNILVECTRTRWLAGPPPLFPNLLPAWGCSEQ